MRDPRTSSTASQGATTRWRSSSSTAVSSPACANASVAMLILSPSSHEKSPRSGGSTILGYTIVSPATSGGGSSTVLAPRSRLARRWRFCDRRAKSRASVGA